MWNPFITWLCRAAASAATIVMTRTKGHRAKPATTATTRWAGPIACSLITASRRSLCSDHMTNRSVRHVMPLSASRMHRPPASIATTTMTAMTGVLERTAVSVTTRSTGRPGASSTIYRPHFLYWVLTCSSHVSPATVNRCTSSSGLATAAPTATGLTTFMTVNSAQIAGDVTRPIHSAT